MEAWSIVACHGVRGTGQQYWEAQCAGISPPGGGCRYPYHRVYNPAIEIADFRARLPQTKLQGRSTAAPISRKSD